MISLMRNAYTCYLFYLCILNKAYSLPLSFSHFIQFYSLQVKDENVCDNLASADNKSIIYISDDKIIGVSDIKHKS